MHRKTGNGCRLFLQYSATVGAMAAMQWGAPVPIPASPRTGGLEYVWHCHILEHEEHDMMRPLVITP